MKQSLWPFVGLMVLWANLASGELHDEARTGRFSRPETIAIESPDYQSFVISLDHCLGIELDPMGDQSSKYPGDAPWFSRIQTELRRHFDADTGDWTLDFENPIVAFGTSAGGSPLFTNRSYGFGVYAGGRDEDYPDITFQIHAYRKSDFHGSTDEVAPVETLDIRIPRKQFVEREEWDAFIKGGYEVVAEFRGLQTTIRLNEVGMNGEPWGAGFFDSPYLVKHVASSDEYFYLVEVLGFWVEPGYTRPMVRDADGYFANSKLYTLDFEERAAWQASFLEKPHFEGDPMPPHYVGRSVRELLEGGEEIDIMIQQDPQNCLDLDNSPELRSHEILDQFVEDMGNDPIALSNYVLNEIGLVDFVAYNESGLSALDSVNLGGINRSALGVFLEGQGSPAEQCALLIYLLRKAGYPAMYLYPEDQALKMLDRSLGALWGIQIQGAVDNFGNEIAPELVPVNYPWVAAYVPTETGDRWIHLFPWMRDLEIVEGLDLYDFLPAGYDNALAWIAQYLQNDPAIVDLDEPGTPAGDLFLRFLEDNLQTHHPHTKLADIGVQYRQRRNYYLNWEDFPRPFSVSNTVSERLNWADTEDRFDRLTLKVSEVGGAWTEEITSLRVCDLHHRKLILRTEQTGVNQHELILYLAPYREDQSGIGNFTDPDLLGAQELRIPLSNEEEFRLELTHNRHLHLEENQIPASHWHAFLGLSYLQEVKTSRKFLRGDMLSITLNTGSVTRQMVDLHVQEFNRHRQVLQADPMATPDPNIYPANLLAILGNQYFASQEEFRQLNERLHKIRLISSFSFGITQFKARREANGDLPNNGEIDLIQPRIDVPYAPIAFFGNMSIRGDPGHDPHPYFHDFFDLVITDGSSREHDCINQLFNTEDAISTVRLLQFAQEDADANGGPGIVTLTPWTYQAQGNTDYDGLALKWHDPNIWGVVENQYAPPPAGWVPGWYLQVFHTPGTVTNPTGDYEGVGALFIGRNQAGRSALISENLKGGVGPALGNHFFDPANASQMKVVTDAEGNTILIPTSFDESYPIVGPAAPRDFAEHEVALLDGSQPPTPEEQQSLAIKADKYGYTLTDDYDADRAAIARLAAERGEAAKNYQHTTTELVSDPVNAVTGEFYCDKIDLSLNGPMPLQIRRNYSSLNPVNGSLGYGWKLNYLSFLELLPEIGEIRATEPNGTVTSYVLDPGNPDLWLPEPDANPRHTNVSGVQIGSTSNLLNTRIERQMDGSDTLYILYGPGGAKRTFQVMSFPISTLQRTRPYLVEWEDHKGNTFEFSYGTDPDNPDYGQVRRIKASNGNFLGFYFDPYGRVIEAYTGDGRRVYYAYDEFGDLVKVTRPDGSVCEYEYQIEETLHNGNTWRYSRHLLTRKIEPEAQVLINEYDAQRRVVVQKAPVGDDLNPVTNATFEYTVAGGSAEAPTGHTIVRDAYDRPTRYDYVEGQITTVTDPLNHIDRTEYYAVDDTSPGAYPRAIRRTINRRGFIVEYAYDSAGNISERTHIGDITGDGVVDTAVETRLYNALNLISESTDPLGRTTRWFYEDPDYPYLVTRVELHTAQGMVSQNRFDYHEVSQGSGPSYIEARGLLQRETHAAGFPDEASKLWTHNAQGFATSLTSFTGTSDPDVTVQYQHNLRGELVRRTDALGRNWRYAYDNMGRRIWAEVRDEPANGGGLMSWMSLYYNPAGDLVWSDGPMYAPEDYTWQEHDGAGRRIERVVWRTEATEDGSGVEMAGDPFAVTTYRYDRYNNLIEVYNPRRNATFMTYDAIGRMETKSWFDGEYDAGKTPLSDIRYTYEPGGEVETYTNPLGGVTTNQYNDVGMLISRSRPDDSTSQWRYDLGGRLVKEVYSNGSYLTTDYDDFNRTVTWGLYSPADTLLATSSKRLDRRGNCIEETDREGNRFTRSFDGLDRLKNWTGPASTATSAQQSLTYSYDAAGKVAVVTNALGEKVVTETDALDRPVLLETRDASDQVIRSTSFSYSPDHHATTITRGTGLSAIATTSYVNTQGQQVLLQHADGTWTRSKFDAGGLLLSHRDKLAQVIRYTFDPLNRLHTETLPDGATTTFLYDAAGNLTERQMPQGLTAITAYDAANRPISSHLANGGLTSRHYSFSYYDSTDAWPGFLQSTTDPRGVVSTLSYDDFLRRDQVAFDGPLPEHDLVLDYAYDLRSLLTGASQTYGDGSVSPASVVSRQFDGYGQLTQEQQLIGVALIQQFDQSWDGAGRRETLTSSPSGFSPSTYGFDYHEDGKLKQVDFAGNAYKFDFADNGLLTSRQNPGRSVTVNMRDSRGRLEQCTTSVGGQAVLHEIQNWKDNNQIDDYLADRLAAGAWDQPRDFLYDDTRQRVIGETYSSWPGGSAETIHYEFDGGASGGLGVRTEARVGAGAPDMFETGAAIVNGLARVTEESTNGAIRAFTATGNAEGAGSLNLALDGVPIEHDHAGWWTNGDWSAVFAAGVGPHQLDATAIHPSGYEVSTTRSFSVAGIAENISQAYDDEGNVISRSTTIDGRTQTLSWDGLGRLSRVEERDSNLDGYDWQAVYDAFGRRLEVRQAAVAGGVAEAPNIIRSGYDPMVEFLELSVSFDDTLLWKVFGPDANGTYGGLNGIGGLEALVLADSPSTPIYTINDTFGNIVGSVGSEGLEWSKVRVGGYGPLPSIAANKLDEASDLADPDLWAWRTRSVDRTGFINCGARHYEPLGGRFLSPDPLGHGSSMSLYDYANGDPINQVDPDGRFGKMVAENWQEDWNRMSDSFYRKGEKLGEDIYNTGEAWITDPHGAWMDTSDGVYVTGEQLGTYLGDRSVNPEKVIDDANAVIDPILEDPGLASEMVGEVVHDVLLGGATGTLTDEIFGAAGKSGKGSKDGDGDTSSSDPPVEPKQSPGEGGGDNELTSVYRAVGPEELSDIENTGQFINRGSAEGKYFTSSEEAAADYAKQAVNSFGDPPYTTVKTEIPRSELPDPVHVDGGIPAYVIPDADLPQLKPEVLPTMPIPRK